MNLAKHIDAAEDYLIEFDHRTHELFEPHRETAAVKALDVFSKLGDQPQMRAFCGAVIIGGMLLGRRRLVRAGFRMLVAHEAATSLKSAIKLQINRTRPRSASKRAQKKIRKGNSKAKELSSFPSGHSAGAMAVARAFGREFPQWRAAALGSGLAVAGSQIPRCAHYPTDVLAGMALGTAGEGAVNLLWEAAGLELAS